MASLTLERFRCVSETSGGDSDSPYFLVFFGKASNPAAADVVRIRREAWDNTIDTNDFVHANALVASGVDTGTLVLVAMLEEDDGPDIDGANLAVVRQSMRTMFTAFSASGSASVASLAPKMALEFFKVIAKKTGNDDIIGPAWLEITTNAGELPLVHLLGDGGHYKVRFGMS